MHANLNRQEAHLKFGVHPDLAVFAKALGNGHPMAAVIGTGAAMSGAHDSFISSTYWTESIGPVASLATLRKLDCGFLAGTGLYPTVAHTDAILARFGEAVEGVFGEIAGILLAGDDPARHLRGPAAHNGFRRLTK